MKIRIINVFLLIVSITIIVFEYIVLLWNWAGGGVFSLLAIPIALCFYLTAFIYLKKSILSKRSEQRLRTAINFLTAMLVPILTVVTVQLMALLFGIKNTIA